MIAEWVLILTMITNDGVFIQQITFSGRDTCMAAGQQWMNNTYPRIDPDNWRYVPNFVCARK
jgi:hypothetical protein